MMVKRFLLKIWAVALLCVAGGICANAQTESGLKMKPEFTLRESAQIYAMGTEVTGGVRLNDEWTVGLMAGRGEVYVDAAPGHIYSVETCAYQRFYIHLGKRDIISLYSDIAVGADWVYDVTGKYHYDGQTGEPVGGELIDTDPGDVRFLAMWQPGIKLRFYKNIHIFTGPMISTKSLGLHLGVGF
ncbi:MAG: hypothetical protein Q4G10_03760 [Bacteroidia bacterium]|nr:hypothetical protein [Bacteroidia bacterium]